MEQEDLVKVIVQWLALNSEQEHPALSPCPGWVVNLHDLLDFLISVTSISEEQVDAWIVQAATLTT